MPSDPTASQPRDIGPRLAQALALAEGGALGRAKRQIDDLSQHPQMTPALLDVLHAQIDAAVLARGNGLLDLPADRWTTESNAMLPLLRRIAQPGADLPRPYPPGLGLPAASHIAGPFLPPAIEPARRLPSGAPQGLGSVQIILSTSTPEPDLARLRRTLATQSLRIPLAISVFSETFRSHSRSGAVEMIPHAIHTEAAQEALSRIALHCDQMLLLSGSVELDDLALERLCRVAACSSRIVQPLVPPANPPAPTPFAHEAIAARYPMNLPFRGLQGLNMMMSAALWREVGGLCHRFTEGYFAGLELGFRLFVAGAWFLPQQVPGLAGYRAQKAAPADIALYRALCPNRVDRPENTAARYEVPRVSIYIPAYNAARFLPEAIDSVLAQDYPDLEVCVHDDGSNDGTIALLTERYGNDPRVRWQSGPNGGIGDASNRAIALGRGLYVGQLDSDDRLLPGAVRRMVEVLEAHPALACLYASCERIDATGKVIGKEYNWPKFSREKLMLTSIVHHFRMFRRQAFMRTDGFRADIRNAVDYDIFLKIAEVGRVHHLNEVLYQRRWHDTNTSRTHEGTQTENTYVVQRAALRRMGLERWWNIEVPDPTNPRLVTYRRTAGAPMVLFWPDYSADNPYQRLLYAGIVRDGAEVCSALPETALAIVRAGSVQGADLTFHLHWLNYIFRDVTEAPKAKAAAEHLLAVLRALKQAEVRLVWTVHNVLSHDSPFPDLEAQLSRAIAALVDVLHFHAPSAVAEARKVFALPDERVCVAPHGSYIGCYPDYVSPEAARGILGLAAEDDVVLFAGAVRPYKGVPELLGAFRQVLTARPNARLVLAGAFSFDPYSEIGFALNAQERARIVERRGYIEDEELQLYYRAADVAALPYRQVLTSGSALLALGFGVPIVLPEGPLADGLLGGTKAGATYQAAAGGLDGQAALAKAIATVLARKDDKTLNLARTDALRIARCAAWPNMRPILLRTPAKA